MAGGPFGPFAIPVEKKLTTLHRRDRRIAEAPARKPLAPMPIAHLTGYAYFPNNGEHCTTWIVPERVPLIVGPQQRHVGHAWMAQSPDGTISVVADLHTLDGVNVPHGELCLGLMLGPGWSDPLVPGEEKLKLRGATVHHVRAGEQNEDRRIPPYALWRD